MLRSERLLRLEASLRRDVERLQSERGATDEWEQRDRDLNLSRLAQIEVDLSSIGEGMDWVFDGFGVFETGMSALRLAKLVDPLSRSFRAIANDLVSIEGGTARGARVKELAEPVFSGTFAGSFGIRLTRAPNEEQTELNQGTLFERTASRIVQIYDAAHQPDSRSAIVEVLEGLRRNSLAAIRDLSQQLRFSDRASVIRWQGDTVVAVSPSNAEQVVDAIAGTDMREEQREIIGRLEGGDLETGRFHIVDDEGSSYTGRAERDAAMQLSGLTLGEIVTAQLIVVITDAPALSEPSEDYTLVQIARAIPTL